MRDGGGGAPLWDGSELRFEYLTSPEVADALERGFDSVVFSCGAVEQHGPAIAMSMDAVHGSGLALAVARRLGNTLVAPTVPIGCSEHHMAFAGTLTLRKETFVGILEDYVSSLVRHGFKRIVILPTHGGNFAPLAEAHPGLQALAGEGVTVQVYTDLLEVMEVWTGVAEESDGTGWRVGGHADVAEGSIMMALRPERVRPHRVEPGRVGPLDNEVTAALFREGMAAVSPNGILGDPTGMNAALGRRLVEALAEAVVRTL